MARNVQRGSQGTEVLTVETKLTENGYFVGQVDEVFDEYTDAAVRYYQSVNSLTVDGVVGPITRASLGIEDGGGSGGGGGGGGAEDVEFGIRIAAMEADRDGVHWQGQAYGWRGGRTQDYVSWSSYDGAVQAESWIDVEVGPHGTYDQYVSMPAEISSYRNAEAGRDVLVTVATNAGGQGGMDSRTEQILGWSGGV